MYTKVYDANVWEAGSMAAPGGQKAHTHTREEAGTTRWPPKTAVESLVATGGPKNA